jgi:acetyl-CoA synthetase
MCVAAVADVVILMWCCAGDGCRRDENGYYWITGRVDDVINVSGHRVGTAEVESALASHDKCAEAAVIG